MPDADAESKGGPLCRQADRFRARAQEQGHCGVLYQLLGIRKITVAVVPVNTLGNFTFGARALAHGNYQYSPCATPPGP